MTHTTMTYPVKIAGTNIFTAESTTPDTAAAWAQHRPWHELAQSRKLQAGESEPYLTSLVALKAATRRGKTLGYYQVAGGYMIGWVGPQWDSKFNIIKRDN